MNESLRLCSDDYYSNLFAILNFTEKNFKVKEIAKLQFLATYEYVYLYF